VLLAHPASRDQFLLSRPPAAFPFGTDGGAQDFSAVHESRLRRAVRPEHLMVARQFALRCCTDWQLAISRPQSLE
jgi:hypothetical protein